MKGFYWTWFVVLLIACNNVFGDEKKSETLYSKHGKVIDITYEIHYNDKEASIRFHRPETDKETILLFTKNGGYGDDVSFKGEHKKISLPNGITIKEDDTDKGFLDLDHYPNATLTLIVEGPGQLKIPVYAAKKKRKTYTITDFFGDLVIDIKLPTAVANKQESNTNTGKRTTSHIIEDDDEESEWEWEDEAKSNILKAREGLKYFNSLPPSEGLMDAINKLRILLDKDLDKATKEKIKSTIEEYENKSVELDNKNREEKIKQEQRQKEETAFNECENIEDYEKFIEQYPNSDLKQSAQSKLDKLRKQRKRNIWMIIGGILLAILLFVGNQVLQSYRNIRSQRRIMEMQQGVGNQAQNAAKRKVTRAVQNKTHQITTEVRKKKRDFLQKSVDKTMKKKGNNDKPISI